MSDVLPNFPAARAPAGVAHFESRPGKGGLTFRGTELDAEFSQLTGFDWAPGSELSAWGGSEAAPWLDFLTRVAQQGGASAARLRGASGAWVNAQAIASGDAHSRRIALAVTRGESEAKADERSEFLFALAEKLASANEEREIVRIATESLGRYFRADRCYFVECLERENRIAVGPNWTRAGSTSLEGTLPLFDFGGMEWWQNYAAGDFAVEDVEKNPLTREKAARYLAIDVRSYAVQPFQNAGEWKVVLAVTDRVPRTWSVEELHLLDDVIARVWPLVARARANQILRERELWFRDALASAGLGSWRADLARGLGTRDAALNRILGHEPVASTQPIEDCFRLVNPADKPAALAAWQRAIETKGIYETEFRIEREDGTRRWVAEHGRVNLGPDGQPAFVTGVTMDITDRRTSEDSLRKNEAFLKSVVGSSADCIKVLDLDGKLQWMSENGKVIMEVCDFSTIKDAYWPDFWKDAETREAALRSVACAREGRTSRFRGFCLTCAGNPRWWDVVVSAIPDAQGRPTMILSVSRDVTTLREAEESLVNSRAVLEKHASELEKRVEERTLKLQETINELSSFSYSISHDLRAPLRAMQSFADILAEECGERLTSDGREYLRRIAAAANRMDRLIQDVLVYSRVARTEMPLERIELGTLIAGIIESYPQFLNEKDGITASLPLAAVRGNPTALTQCLSNLLGNAIKFGAANRKPQIRIWTERIEPGWVRLNVSDNGIGIAPEDHAKIFGIFYQIDPHGEGTGIGLAIARKAVERMGGKLSLTSALAEGSVFHVDLLAPV